jgi:glycosyltransferase involved in cell wall biosynthesis
VIYLGTISYNELPKYYQKAKALIFASTCENCPNILLEKMASKKMIFCSSHQPMPEFGKDSVVYFDPVDENNLVKQILKYSDEKQKDKYEIKTYNNALEYDWKKTSKKTFEFLVGN